MRALFDTNAEIYLQKGLLRHSLPPGEYFISAITELELLSFHGLDDDQQRWLNALPPTSASSNSTRGSRSTACGCVANIACVCPMPSLPRVRWHSMLPC